MDVLDKMSASSVLIFSRVLLPCNGLHNPVHEPHSLPALLMQFGLQPMNILSNDTQDLGKSFRFYRKFSRNSLFPQNICDENTKLSRKFQRKPFAKLRDQKIQLNNNQLKFTIFKFTGTHLQNNCKK
jgi:hypothetical protein